MLNAHSQKNAIKANGFFIAWFARIQLFQHSLDECSALSISIFFCLHIPEIVFRHFYLSCSARTVWSMHRLSSRRSLKAFVRRVSITLGRNVNFFVYFKLCSNDPSLSDPTNFRRVECMTCCPYTLQFKRSELDPTKLDRVNRAFGSCCHTA